MFASRNYCCNQLSMLSILENKPGKVWQNFEDFQQTVENYQQKTSRDHI